MPSLIRIVMSSLVAYLVYGLCSAVMFVIPATPHHRSLEQTHVLDSYQNASDFDAANAAFDEWLRISRQAEWVEATILTALAASAVLFLWRRARPLSAFEIGSIVAIFIAIATWRSGSIGIDTPLVTTAFVFALILSIATVCQLRSVSE